MDHRRSRVAAAIAALAALTLAAGCSSSASGSTANGAVKVVAAENFYGNIVSQLGGSRVAVTSIINSPDTDPHLYESNAHDSAAVSDARLVVENGLGYDDFIDKLQSASPSSHRVVVNVATTLHVSGDNANPHLWYDVSRIGEVAQAI